jgi:hypothetical protein
MFEVELPVAVVTVEAGGAVVVPVVERADGVLVERESGRPVELLDVVVVLGLPELEPAAA